MIQKQTKVFAKLLLERLRNENEDKTKTQMTQSFNQYSENETKIWRQNILYQFNRVSSSSSCLRSRFVISLTLASFAKALKSFPVFQENLHCKQKWPKIKYGKILKTYPLAMWQSIEISVLFHPCVH